LAAFGQCALRASTQRLTCWPDRCAQTNGGAISAQTGYVSLSVDRSTFQGNVAVGGNGGAIYFDGNQGSLHVASSSLVGNRAAIGRGALRSGPPGPGSAGGTHCRPSACRALQHVIPIPPPPPSSPAPGSRPAPVAPRWRLSVAHWCRWPTP